MEPNTWACKANSHKYCWVPQPVHFSTHWLWAPLVKQDAARRGTRYCAGTSCIPFWPWRYAEGNIIFVSAEIQRWRSKTKKEHSTAVRWQPTHSAVSTSHYMDWKHQRDTSAKLNLVEKAIKQTNKKGKLNHPSDGLVPTDVSSIPCWSVSHQMFPDFSTAL